MVSRCCQMIWHRFSGKFGFETRRRFDAISSGPTGHSFVQPGAKPLESSLMRFKGLKARPFRLGERPKSAYQKLPKSSETSEVWRVGFHWPLALSISREEWNGRPVGAE